MDLPFSHAAFLDVFGAYNVRFWPVVVLLWVATAGVAWRWLRGGPVSGRTMCALLSFHWAWSGIAYHWMFFREVNPAAGWFAAAFVLQAAVFAWLAVSGRALAPAHSGPRGVIGHALVLYGLAYPILGLSLGLTYPRAPLFAVPCPTALVTAGVLVTMTGAPRGAGLLPMLWAIVGSSAAFVLGIRADLALVVAAGVLAVDIASPSALGPRGGPSSAGV